VYVIAGCDLHKGGSFWNKNCVVKECGNVLGAAGVGLVFVGLVLWERGRVRI